MQSILTSLSHLTEFIGSQMPDTGFPQRQALQAVVAEIRKVSSPNFFEISPKLFEIRSFPWIHTLLELHHRTACRSGELSLA